MPIINRWFLGTASPYQRSRRGTGSWCGEGNSHTQINEGDQCIGRGYHLVEIGTENRESIKNITIFFSVLRLYTRILPQTFSGASNSSNIGCSKNISRDLRHRAFTSVSASCTVFMVRLPRAVQTQHKKAIKKSTIASLASPSKSLDIILSISMSKSSAIPASVKEEERERERER